VLYNACVSCAHRDGSGLDRAIELLRTMKEEGLVPDAITYSAAINAAATHGSQWQQALSLLREMRRARPRLQPHRPAYNAMLKVSAGSMHVLHFTVTTL
jgi:pentatricopeptide repeat protein